MTGVKCQKAGGHCVGTNDPQKCMVPLKEEPDCPKGEQCCKTGVANLPLTKGKKNKCKPDSKCTDVGGKCIHKKEKCTTKKDKSLCKGKNCACCLPLTPPPTTLAPALIQQISNLKIYMEVQDVTDHLESLIRSMNTTLDHKLTEIDEEIHQTCPMIMNERIPETMNYYIFAIPMQLLGGVDVCPPDGVLVPYEIPSFQSYAPSAEGITCTNNAWVLEQHALGLTNCSMGLQYNTDFWWNDAPDWIEVHQPYYEAMRNCYANSCNGLVCTDDFDTCWLKINTPGGGHGEPFNATNRNFWTTVCQKED